MAGLALWGIGDILQPSRDKTLATIGNESISQSEINREVNSSLQKLGSRQLSDELLEEFKRYITENVLLQKINRKLIDIKSKDLSLELSEKQIIKKEFLTDAGYSKEQLNRFIRSQGGQDFFLNNLLEEKRVSFIESVFSSIPLIDKTSIDALHNLEKQTRDITLIKFETNNIADIKDPEQNEILPYYNESKNNFLAPEHRSITYILLDKSIIVDEVDEDVVADILYETSNTLLDKLAEGLSLEEAAENIGAKVKKISSINMKGLSEDGAIVENLPKINNFLQTTFSTEEGETSELIESSSGDQYALIRVDSIAPQRIKALDEVRPLVISAWKKAKKLEQLLTKADEIKNEINAGQSLKSLEKKYDFKTEILKNITRNSNKIPAALLDETFKLKLNKASNVNRSNDNNLLITVLDKINKPSKADPFEVLQSKDKIEQEMFQEAIFLYIEHLKTKYKVTINN